MRLARTLELGRLLHPIVQARSSLLGTGVSDGDAVRAVTLYLFWCRVQVDDADWFWDTLVRVHVPETGQEVVFPPGWETSTPESLEEEASRPRKGRRKTAR